MILHQFMKTVLVAEDNPILADVLRFNLQREGFGVTVAKSGTMAIQQLSRQMPDVLITDFQMPGASGEEVCRHVREELKNLDLPIIVCSAKGIELNSSGFMERWNVAKIMYKPFSMREIVSIIAELCENKFLAKG